MWLLLACLIYADSVEALQDQNCSRSEKQLSVFTGFESVKKINKSYDDSVKLKRTEMDPFRLGLV